MLHVKLIEPPCTERYARWCERSKIPHQEEFSPTRFLEMCYVLSSYAHLIIDVENEINVRTTIYLNYFKRSGETLFIYFSREV